MVPPVATQRRVPLFDNECGRLLPMPEGKGLRADGFGMIYSPSHGDTEFTVPLFGEFMLRVMPTAQFKRRN